MAKLRVLVQRRKAIRNIRKITRTMELIATARFKKALDRATEAAVYTRKIAELAADLTGAGGEVSHPLLVVRPVRKELILVIASNRGLCGGYNASILREASGHIRRLAGRRRSRPRPGRGWTTSSSPAPRTSWRNWCRRRSRPGCSSAFWTRRSASRSPGAWR